MTLREDHAADFGAARSQTARRDFLRAATADIHARLDGTVAEFLGRSDAGYRRLLDVHHAALGAVEPALERAGAGALLDDWPIRRKLGWLEADLRALGAPAPAPQAIVSVPLPSAAAVLGALYVVEGATLGGAYLERQVLAQFPEAAGATRYFASYGPARGERWRAFLRTLEAHPAAWADESGLVAGACATFARFSESFATLGHAKTAIHV